VSASQRLQVTNRTSDTLDVKLAQFAVHLAPGQTHLFDAPFGTYLAPGVHFVSASRYPGSGGAELWLLPDASPADTSIGRARVSVDGLELAVRISPGPYFLGQLISADVSLTNHTQGTVVLPDLRSSGPCGAALDITLTGGGLPGYTLPNATVHGCPAPGVFSLRPAQSLTIHHFVPLTRSGRVTLTATAVFLQDSVRDGGHTLTRIPSPFEGRGPVVELVVAPRAPAERRLALQRAGAQVVVLAPARARPQLLYLYNVRCHDEQGPGATESGNYTWQAVPNGQIALPSCPGTQTEWTVSVGAPGYAIVSGTYR
jgi:hypothetical protein